MTKRLLLLLLCSCRAKAMPSEADVASVAVASNAVADAGVPVDARPPPSSPRDIVDRWNEAHVKHDASALESLYAPKVYFYGRDLSNVECAKRKAEAFAKSPDFTQSIDDVVIEPSGDFVTLTKTTTSGGTSKTYLSWLAIRDGKISLENDHTSATNLDRAKNWCVSKDGVPSDELRPPYRISAKTAAQEVKEHRVFQEFQKGWANFGVSVSVCPQGCAPGPEGCAYGISIYRSGVTGPAYIDLVYVDAAKNVLRYQKDGAWKSEPFGD